MLRDQGEGLQRVDVGDGAGIGLATRPAEPAQLRPAPAAPAHVVGEDEQVGERVDSALSERPPMITFRLANYLILPPRKIPGLNNRRMQVDTPDFRTTGAMAAASTSRGSRKTRIQRMMGSDD